MIDSVKKSKNQSMDIVPVRETHVSQQNRLITLTQSDFQKAIALPAHFPCLNEGAINSAYLTASRATCEA